MGKVLGIATRVKTKASMDVCNSAKVLFNTGVGDDSRGLKKGNRQVTVLGLEGWERACSELNQTIPWTTRRANFLVSGIKFENTKGTLLKIGTCLLEITGELVPCNRMDEQTLGLTNVLVPNWRGGVTCKMVEEGVVSVGDEAVLLERESD
ncbi:MAG: hypothetical protein P8Q14_01575 [Vicingaceae bacterium]|nr:hypothetical protein [Vicingaceae bacterium]